VVLGKRETTEPHSASIETQMKAIFAFSLILDFLFVCLVGWLVFFFFFFLVELGFELKVFHLHSIT
jgi:hypothetical protein